MCPYAILQFSLQKPLDVTLSPPPDLSVVNLKIVNFKSTFVTGEIAQIEWIVRNEGSRQPDVSTWIDAIVSLKKIFFESEM